MAMNKEQEDLYRKTMEEAKKQLDGVDEEMEKELQKTREKLAKLQNSKSSYKRIYVGLAELLGEDVDIETDEDENSSEEKASRLSGVQ
jgi:uncharacterized membrane-anchored protein YhcB (DUF1043 family)